MPLPDPLNLQDTDLPACPRSLLDMLVLLDDDEAPVTAMSTVIEGDLALAAAVVRTINSAMYGLLRRVETVSEAVRYIGTREVAAITFATALRAAFPITPQLEAVWTFSSRCGLLMGRSAASLQLDPWRAHTAGLFARCGQAVLLAKYPVAYPELMAAVARDAPLGLANLAALTAAETEAFGVNHAQYGSALCAAWGLSGDVVRYVRDRVEPADRWLDHSAPLRDLLTIGALVESLLEGADADECAAQLTTLLQLPAPVAALAAVRKPWERLMASDSAH